MRIYKVTRVNFQNYGPFLVLVDKQHGRNNSKVSGFNQLQLVYLNIINNISMSQEQPTLHKNTSWKIKLGSCM